VAEVEKSGHVGYRVGVPWGDWPQSAKPAAQWSPLQSAPKQPFGQ